ncbi:glycine oxidase ThiO [Saccharopolyspora antimicrobica]|uniref:glycine oxidase ThiO n=1 Tax=Saccharopolyspora antimicrobica TaxID=455193 RepID=UPI000B8900BF|nr:glycine oxidase ThiO [Saccharopolyspora antimicrobica]
MRTAHVVVVGGGVIGMSVAWRAAAAGHRVQLVDPEPASGASFVAGGMLAPIAEAWPGEEELLELGSTSLERWPGFADELSRASGLPSGLRREGTLVVGVDSADRAELDELAGYLSRQGRTVTRLSGREVRRLEPSLGPAVRGGLEVPGDLAVDNRSALAALRAAATAAGVEFVAATARTVRAGAVELEDSTVECDVAVIAAGAHSGALHPSLRGRIRPVKGEILRLRARATALPPPSRTVRGPVHGRPVYLVPRDDGGLVLGATQYEVGFDTEVTLGGVRDLIADAEQVMPGIAEYQLVEARAGLRPSTDDNLPVLGWLEPGVLAATAHHRGGFLLAPVTADAVLALLRGDEPDALIKATDPNRWGGQQCTS